MVAGIRETQTSQSVAYLELGFAHVSLLFVPAPEEAGNSSDEKLLIINGFWGKNSQFPIRI